MKKRDMSEELKPCPFCGGAAGVFPANYDLVGPKIGFAAGCKGDQPCLVECGTDIHKTEAEAITAWNTRSADTETNNAKD